MEIRPALQRELPLLRQIAIETFEDTFAPFNSRQNMEAFLSDAYTQERFDQEWSEPGSIFYLAWDGAAPAGYARLRLSREVEQLLGDNTIELQRLYVLPQHKGKKAGSKLMEAAVRYAMSKDHEWLWLGVWERNFAAQKFYASWGFEKFSEHVFVMGDDPQIDWLLKKNIS